MTWDTEAPEGVLSFTRDPGFRCVVNLGDQPADVPADAEVLLASEPLAGRQAAGRRHRLAEGLTEKGRNRSPVPALARQC